MAKRKGRDPGIYARASTKPTTVKGAEMNDTTPGESPATIQHTDIIEALAAVWAECGYVQKHRGTNLPYTYARETDYIAEIRPAMVRHGVVMFPVDYEDVHYETYQTAKGGMMTRCTLKATFQFAVRGGGNIVVCAMGEGTDSGDKSTNKAMTAAKKYALNQSMLIATGDDPDDYASGESERAPGENYSSRSSRKPPETAQKRPQPPKGTGDAEWDRFAEVLTTEGLREAAAMYLQINSAAGIGLWKQTIQAKRLGYDRVIEKARELHNEASGAPAGFKTFSEIMDEDREAEKR